uniref:Uncharacterized protein n=1 Tax=Helianthus annuus TaxID=4232 RepID=A0A251RUQ2_HELAN
MIDQRGQGETLVSPSSSNSVGVLRKIGCMNPNLQTSNLVQIMFRGESMEGKRKGMRKHVRTGTRSNAGMRT